jgi:hypothetical protein
MMEAYRLTRKDGAPGIDGVMAADYEVNLEANLLDLLDRIKSGRYRAPPVRRAYILKADGSQRMLGVPTFEDKVAQRAVTMMLEEISEQHFLSCSYGFRPGRSAHPALRTLQNVLWAKRLYWVLDIDAERTRRYRRQGGGLSSIRRHRCGGGGNWRDRNRAWPARIPSRARRALAPRPDLRINYGFIPGWEAALEHPLSAD